MIIETAICVGALVTTIVIVVFTFRWWRQRHWLTLGIALAGMALMHVLGAGIAGPHMRAYLYRTADPEVTFLECPFKGISYESMISRCQKEGNSTELFRTFEQNWWNYYRWHDYLTHPRWKLPYRPDEGKRG